MSDILFDEGLRFEGFNDQQIAELKARLPDAIKLVAKIQAVLATKATPAELVAEVAPLIPAIEKLLPDMRMVLAVVQATQERYR